MSSTHELDVREAKYIIMELFPAEVELDGVSLGNANKVVVTDNRVYIIQDSVPGPVVYFQDGTSYAQFDRPSIREYTVATDEGRKVTFRRAQHCACGNRLRGVFPFLGVPHAAQKPISKK